MEHSTGNGHVAARGRLVALLLVLAASLALIPMRQAAAAPLGFMPTDPARLLDTRTGQPTVDGLFAGGGALAEGGTLNVTVVGRGGVPGSGVVAVALNVTAVSPSSGGYTTVWPAGEPMPNASSLNWSAGAVVPNLVVAKVGANGQVSIFNSTGTTDYIADVVGYFDATGVVPLSPIRLMDTRPGFTTIDGTSAGAGPVGPAAEVSINISGRGTIPSSDVTAVILNVTAVTPTADGYATVWPSGEGRPNASSLNWAGGSIVPNLVFTKLGSGGQISIYNSTGSTNFIVDAVGYFTSSNGYVGLSPARLADTRVGYSTIDGSVAGVGRSGAKYVLDIPVSGRGGVPSSGVAAVVVNVTAVAPVAGGYATVFPSHSALPVASNLNFTTNVTRPNLVVAKLGAGGRISIFTSDNGTATWAQPHYVVDVVGYFPGTTPPAQDLSTASATQLDSGWNFNCALASGGTVRCWGDGRLGQLGDGTGLSFSRPVQVQGITNAVQVVANGYHACARLADTTVRCWGNNGNGQLGDGTTQNRMTPVAVTGLSGVVDITAGYWHSCAVLADTSLRCWGYNGGGQFGNGVNSFPFAATNPLPLAAGNGTTGWSKITGGAYHSCAIKTDQTVWCWGAGGSGQIGNGTTSGFMSPLGALPGLTGITAVSTFWNTSCAAGNTGTIWCWGDNTSGQALAAAGANVLSPTAVPTLGSELSVGDSTSCTAAAGTRCWGSNSLGQMGTATGLGLTNQPVTALPAVTVNGSMTVGGPTTCAIILGGGVGCVGAGSAGQRGDGTTLTGIATVSATVVGFGSAPVFIRSIDAGTNRQAAPELVVSTTHAPPTVGSPISGTWASNSLRPQT